LNPTFLFLLRFIPETQFPTLALNGAGADADDDKDDNDVIIEPQSADVVCIEVVSRRSSETTGVDDPKPGVGVGVGSSKMADKPGAAIDLPVTKAASDLIESDEEFLRTPEVMPARLNFSSRKRLSPARSREPSDKYRFVIDAAQLY